MTDAFSQSHVYKHYGVEDGLPSSEVYSAFQDSKGYMWFATDAGVSRFNGYEFENFDASDGLTDNTVFLITEDSKGRIWFGTFNCQISYYENDSIYPYKYNKELEKIASSVPMNSFYVDEREKIWLGFSAEGSGGLYKCDGEGLKSLMSYDDETNLRVEIIKKDGIHIVQGYIRGKNALRKATTRKLFYEKSNITVNYLGELKQFTINRLSKSNQHFLFEYLGTKIIIYGGINNTYILSEDNLNLLKKVTVPQSIKNEQIRVVYSQYENVWLISVGGGVFKTKLENDTLRVYDKYLMETDVSRVFEDNNGGYWFLTLKEGIYYMPSVNINYNPNINLIEIDTITGNIYKGKETITVINQEGVVLDEVFTKKGEVISNAKYNYNNNSLLISDYIGRFKYYQKNKMVDIDQPSAMQPKSFLIDNDFIYRVGSYGISIIKDNKEIYYSYKEGVPKMWCTSLVKVDKEIWIGTKDGVRVFFNKKITNPFKNDKYLSTSITSMSMQGEDIVLIGTKSYGLLIVKNDSVITIIDEKKGLASNLVRTIHVDNQKVIWVGTNKGISRINFVSHDNYEIYNITQKHGLISGEIKDIASYKNMIYAVTVNGLIQFDKTTIQPNLIPPIVYVSSFRVNEKLKNLSENNVFSYQENSINITYEGLNYRSVGEVEYQYRMLGVDTTWITTVRRDVRYPALSFGEYSFQVKAKNEDGVWNKNPASIDFIIKAPFWLTWWFITLIIVLIIAVVGLVFRYREKRLVKQNEISKKNAETEKRMVELELKALRSQMNPHFIFNTLNSIQHYISVNDYKSTNRYITQFAKLIRTVLHLSEKSFITIQEELDMLNLYMNLEKMRFDEQFSYEISVSEDIDVDYDEIPSMLIQPYVENSIWHGLMNKTKKGEIKIRLYLSEDQLCCSIQDNGIGREKAAEIKARRKIAQKSVGMSITKERLDIFSENNVNVITTDLKDEHGNALGTKIEIKIPYKN